MLFNTAEFVFGFLPIAVVGFFICARLSSGAAWTWLLLASFWFYGAWKPEFLLLLISSILVNYGFAGLVRAERPAWAVAVSRRAALIGAIVLNLAALAYFKYAYFIAGILADVARTEIALGDIVLPVGISFFTFTQIAFLVDTYRGETGRLSVLRYALFVTYFPHLVAGPVLYHRDILPQFRDTVAREPAFGNLLAGLALFLAGLYKKLILADGVAPYAEALFQEPGAAPSFVASWTGALAYTFQIYFDFSAYSDMAIGLSLIFGVRIPFNFNSPYRATSIIDFWRRWHISLSRFLRDYLYIPLGGNRLGLGRRYGNIMVTMLLGGLWHGAGWTFIFWGGVHGAFLVINHAWRRFRGSRGAAPAPQWAGRLATFLAVVALWVPFRADSLTDAFAILAGMAGLNGISGAVEPAAVTWLAILLIVVWFVPNTQQLLAVRFPVIAPADRAASSSIVGLVSSRWFLPVAASGSVALLLVLLLRTDVSPFIYFSF